MEVASYEYRGYICKIVKDEKGYWGFADNYENHLVFEFPSESMNDAIFDLDMIVDGVAR